MSPQARLVAALSLIFGTYALSANVTRALIENLLHTMRCTTSFLTTVCDYPADAAMLGSAQAWLAAFLCVAGLACWFIRKSSAYPFLALAVLLCSGALLWDFLFEHPIIHGPKIVNDTLNILGAVIAASFCHDCPDGARSALFARKIWNRCCTVLRRQDAFLGRLCGVEPKLFGVTELFLLYIVYSLVSSPSTS